MVQPAFQWEWRTFAPELAPLALTLPASFEAIDETLIVCPESDTRTVISHDLLKVGVLVDRHDDLELWQHALTAGFPLCQRDVRDVLRQYPLTPPTLCRPEYGAFEFVTEVATCTNGLRVIGTRLFNRRISIDDCTLDRSAVSILGNTLQSLALSSPDPEAVRRLLARLRLDRLENLNIVALVKRLLGIPAAGRIPSIVGDFSHAR